MGTGNSAETSTEIFSTKVIKVQINPNAPAFSTQPASDTYLKMKQQVTLSTAIGTLAGSTLTRKWQVWDPDATPAAWKDTSGTAASFTYVGTSQGTFKLRMVAIYTAGGAVTEVPSEAATIVVSKHDYDISSGFRIVITGNDTVFKDAKVTPAWTLQRNSTGNTWVNTPITSTFGTVTTGTASESGKTVVKWGTNVDAGDDAGEITVFLPAVTGVDGKKSGGIANTAGDTLYGGTITSTFRIGQRALATSETNAGYVGNFFEAWAKEDWSSRSIMFDGDSIYGFIKDVTDNSDVDNTDGVYLVYRLGSATTNLSGMFNAGTYKPYIVVTTASRNFKPTGNTPIALPAEDVLTVTKAQLSTHVTNTGTTTADGSATAVVVIDEAAWPEYTNGTAPIKLDTSLITVRLADNESAIVPSKDYTVAVDFNAAQDGGAGTKNMFAAGEATVTVTLKSPANYELKPDASGNTYSIKGKITIQRGKVTKNLLTVTKPTTAAQLRYSGDKIDATVAFATAAYNGDAGTITVKYNGEPAVDDPPYPVNAGKYVISVDILNAKNLRDTSDFVVDSFVIAKAGWTGTGNTPSDWLNISSIETALDNTSKESGGVPIVSGTLEELPDGLQVKLADDDHTGLGDVTMEFKQKVSGATWSSALPTVPGYYNVRMTIAAGDNFNALTAAYSFTKELKLAPSSMTDEDFDVGEEDNIVAYGRSKTYTFRGPKVDESEFGTIDSVVYTALKNMDERVNASGTVAAEATNYYKLGTVGPKGATFTLATVTASNLNKSGQIDVGTYEVTAEVRGSKKSPSGAVLEKWVHAGLKIPFVITARDIEDAVKNNEITVTVTTPAAGYSFTGNAVTPLVTVREGSATLTASTVDNTGAVTTARDYALNAAADLADFDEINQINAGPAEVVVAGTGNYTGKVTKGFEILKKVITPAIVTANRAKVYDGTTSIDTADNGDPTSYLAITFGVSNAAGTTAGLTEADAAAAKNVVDYVISNAQIDNANRGSGRGITATVSLVAESEIMKNYQLTGGAASVQVASTASNNTRVNVQVLDPGTLGVDAAFDLSAFPAFKFYNSQAQRIDPAPALLPGLELGGSGSALAIAYYAQDAKAAKDSVVGGPVDAGTYSVKAIIIGSGDMNIKTSPTTSGNFGWDLGMFTINPEAKPIFASNSPRDTTVRFGKTVGIRVGASVPTGSNGTLSYQWFRYASANAHDTTGQLVSGSDVYNYTATDTVGSVLFFGVKVTNTYDGYQASAYAPRKSRVTVLVPPVSMAAATFTIDSVYLANTVFTYNNGSDIKLDVSKVRVQMPSTTVNEVVVPGAVLVANRDYELKYTNNKNAGTATVYASGLDAYEDSTATKTFVIVKKTPVPADFTWNVSNVYTAAANGANVKSKDTTATDATIGALAVKYAGAATVPVNAGTYALTVDVAGGSNFNAAPGLVLGNYTITKAVIDTSWLDYSIPVGHKVGKPDTLGIGPVTMKKGTGVAASAITVKYNGLTALPTVAGKYNVTVDIIGGDNFFSAANLALGVYEIGVGIASGNTKIPTAPKAAVVTVAPVKVAAASFTAGPSPVSKNGVIKFFSAKQVKSGSLYIFDANGNAVTKLSAKAGSGEIASWNLKDKKGVSVAEGSYVVKGALAAKDGTREKVSFVFSVVK